MKVEYQTTAHFLYELFIEKGTKKIAEVANVRRLETPFRSPQLLSYLTRLLCLILCSKMYNVKLKACPHEGCAFVLFLYLPLTFT